MERSVVVLFADLAGYTALTEVHGDQDAAEVADRFYALARANLVGDARLVKTIGDAVMIVATTAANAVATALGLAAAVTAEPAFPTLRVGLHAGVAIERNEDYFGATVNLAARVSSYARGGQILCTTSVADAISGLGIAAVQAIGAAQFKNVQQAVELHSIDQHASGPGDVDPVCRMAVGSGAQRVVHDGKTILFCSSGCAAKFEADPAAYTR